MFLALHGLIHLLDWSWWRPALTSVTLLSLLLTVLGFGPARASIALNLVILALLVLTPRLGDSPAS